jgi:amino acid transporter
MNAATRVFYALARNRLAPRPLGKVHPVFKTPYIAIIWMTAFAIVVSVRLGWKYANWIALGWIAAGLVLTVVLYARYPDRLRDMDRVYVEDETVAEQATPA